MEQRHVRPGFRSLTPYLIATDAAGLIEFVKRTFAGEEAGRAGVSLLAS